MGMTLNELYDRMDGSEIDERLALAMLESPKYQEKLKASAEQERVLNLSPEEQKDMVMRVIKGGI